MAEEKNGISIEGEYLLSASAFRPVKRYDVLLEAYSRLTDAPPLKLLCNTAPALEKLIDKFNLAEKVEILGFTSNPYPVIKQAKMLILSSEREGLPTVLIEALILGTPVVSIDCKSGPSEILTGELSKYLAKINDTKDLSEKISKAVKRYPEIQQTFLNKFSDDDVYRKYMGIMRRSEYICRK
jgi:glycosyltransferase involved in cell wall biosynthesis